VAAPDWPTETAVWAGVQPGGTVAARAWGAVVAVVDAVIDAGVDELTTVVVVVTVREAERLVEVEVLEPQAATTATVASAATAPPQRGIAVRTMCRR
jgi:hypothetical protein